MQKEIEAELYRKCLKDYQKYNDTVTVSAAICHLFKENEKIGRFMGIEPKMKRIGEPSTTPDLAALYDDRTKGMLFEIKWSLQENPERLREKLKELKKYFDIYVNWNNETGRVDFHDVVLVCHPEDSERVVKVIEKASKEVEYNYFNNVGFSVWTWLFSQAKKIGSTDELRIIRIYGETRNEELERVLSAKLGILVSEDVLMFNRFSYFFVREKPPMQYLLNVLIVNVLSNPVAITYEKHYVVTTDWIWNKTKNLILTGEEYDDQSLQIKRRWIRNALDELSDLKIIQKGEKENTWKVPTNLFRYIRKSIHEKICKDLVKKHIKRTKQLKRKLPIMTRSRKGQKLTGKESKMTDYLKK